MKKIICTALMLASLYINAQKNTLLDQGFWKNNPDLTAVKAEIEKGNSPSQLNPMAFDAVVMAINSDASLETIKYLIDQPGNSVKKTTHDARIYLHWAANKGNNDLVNYLIEKGSDINLEDSHGTTPLVFATGSGQANTALYDAFFKAGLDPKKKYRDGANLLLLTIASDKDLRLTNYFITKGMSLKDVDKNGNTAFNYAARSGNIPFLKTLLEKGVKYTDNALINAAQGSRRNANTIEVYQYLVGDLKIKPTAKTPTGQTVLHLLANKDKQAPIVTYFLEKGVDANSADEDGNTAFMIASSGRDIQLLETLLPKVKNINTTNSKGESALTQAVKNSNPEVVTFLLSKGADVKIKDKEGNSLANYLVDSYRAPRGGMPGGPQRGDDFGDKLALLQKNGLDFTAKQKDGNTIYHTAIVKNDLTLLKKIADLKVDVNAQNKEGVTVLQKAAMLSKDDAILKYLLSIGAKKEIKTEFDETAFDLAKENELLKKNGVSIDFLK